MTELNEEPLQSILVVDDEPANLTAAEAVLERLGANVVCAESGAAALRLLLEQEFALILLDVKMPGMDGFEVARAIRSRSRSRRTPIIFVTAHGREEQDLLVAYQLGVVDFLFKPFRAEILRAKASVFIDLARQQRLIREHERIEHERMLESARKTWEGESMRQRMAQLTEFDKHKDEFLARLGHELRNPLAPLVTGLELLRGIFARDPRIDPAAGRTREAMQRQVQHLTRLVDDLLDISRINSGKVELQTATVCIQDVLTQAVALSRPLLDDGGFAILSNVAEERLLVQGDLVRLVQVVTNLLNNAARYTPSGGRIRLHCARVRDQVEVVVEDNGRGIPEAILPHVFEAFVQYEERPSAGLGLGLALVRQLVTLHGGTVSAHSEGAGLGATFTVRLPLDMDAVEVPKTAPPPRPDAWQSEPLIIALVEDNSDIREVMQELLTTWGHAVEVAEDGAAGSELILRLRPDVALIDIGLPGLDGYGVAARVRDSMGNAKPRLVALTGFGRDSDRAQAAAAGFDAHLVKPVAPDDLRRVLMSD
jgi:signal transduction histidine kinase